MNPICCPVQFGLSRNGRKQWPEQEASSYSHVEPGRVPRISRLMALAIRFDELIARGDIKNYAQLARRGDITRARVTQIMNLLHLAPDIQEQVLFLPRIQTGRDPIKLAELQPLTMEIDWKRQRRCWRRRVLRQETMKCTLISGELMGPRFYCDRNWQPSSQTFSKSPSVGQPA